MSYDKNDFIVIKKYGRNIKLYNFICPFCDHNKYKMFYRKAVCCNSCRPKVVGQKLLGRKESLETRKKKSNSRLGFKLSAHAKKKLRQINLGKKHTKETKERCSLASKGRKMSHKARIKISCKHQKIRMDEFKGFTKESINYILRKRIRNRITIAIKNNQKVGSAIENLGCSIEELKKHLESKFQPGMSWDNYGRYGWHIDHVKPLSSFDLANKEEFLKACHYSNLQPLWWKDNLSKGDKYEQ